LKQIRKRLTYANVMSSLAVFLVLGGATAFAASHLGKNSVGSKQLKKNAVTAAKIKNDAVTGAKIKNGAITGAKVNLGSLGTVPSATSAGTANSLAGQTPFVVRLGSGGSQTLATNGAVSIVATCTTDGAKNYARLLAQTTATGAVMIGQDDFNGNTPADFLNPATPPEGRELAEEFEVLGKGYVSNEEDTGFVVGPEGKMLTINGDGLALGLNFAGSTCYFAGIINAVG
jgi:hypothetical protein